MADITEKTKIVCVRCRHFAVTWDKNFPKSCKLFKFKSKSPPSLAVFEATGAQCEHFEIRAGNQLK